MDDVTTLTKAEGKAFASSPEAFYWGIELIVLHDQEGFPFELSCEMAREKNRRPSLLGILIGCTRRGFSKDTASAFVSQWAKCFAPTETEQLVLAKWSCPASASA